MEFMYTLTHCLALLEGVPVSLNGTPLSESTHREIMSTFQCDLTLRCDCAT